jgi:hypothetical protein
MFVTGQSPAWDERAPSGGVPPRGGLVRFCCAYLAARRRGVTLDFNLDGYTAHPGIKAPIAV